jgi:predicted metallopeptidase
MIRYTKSEELEDRVRRIVSALQLGHIDLGRVVCIRSEGSKSRNILARCHTISKVVQHALGLRSHYIIEVVSENFDPLSDEEKTKTLIHELLHIPKAFGGGFRHHADHVNKRTIEKMYKSYMNSRAE